MKKIFIMFTVLAFILTGCNGNKNKEDMTKGSNTESGESVIAESTDTGIEDRTNQEDIDIEEIASNLVADLSNGNYKKAVEEYQYTSQMKSAVNETLLKEQIWVSLVDKYGEFEKIQETTVNKLQQYDAVAVSTVFKTAIVDINIIFDAEKSIGGINFGAIKNKESEEAPSGIVETEITFGKKGWELPGILTTPEEGENFPAIILVHGSGANDKDETIGPNKPFRDIAWELAEKGIATLRYDKRNFVYGKSTIAVEGGTVYDETIEDVVFAFDYLKSVSNIDNKKIYILGHSLGGMLIPRIAELTPEASGYVIMAGPVTPLEDLMIEQIKYLSELDGTVSDDEKNAIESYEKMRDNVKNLKGDSDFENSDLLGLPAEYWLDLKEYDPLEVAQGIERPLLILQGARDYQVTQRDFEMWKESIGNKDNVTCILYEGLNHLFMEGEGKSGPQEYNIQGHVEEKVIEDIAVWIQDN